MIESPIATTTGPSGAASVVWATTVGEPVALTTPIASDTATTSVPAAMAAATLARRIRMATGYAAVPEIAYAIPLCLL